MGWFNIFGLAAVAVILIPNIICALVCKGAFENRGISRVLLVLEGIGRYACMAFCVFNVPCTYWGFWFPEAFSVYLIAGGALLIFYLLGWLLFFLRGGGMHVWLSVTPALFFLFGGVMLLSVPLIAAAILFGITHITISVRNAK